jgi:hypothetical protein
MPAERAKWWLEVFTAVAAILGVAITVGKALT